MGRRVSAAVLFAVVLLGLPWALYSYVPDQLGNFAFVAGTYLVSTAVAWLWRLSITAWPQTAQDTAAATTLLGLLGAIAAAMAAGAEYLMLVSAAAACMVMFLAQYEKQSLNLVYMGTGLVYLALTQAVVVLGLPAWAFGPVVMLPAILLFAVGYHLMSEHPAEGQVLRYAGLVGPFVGVLVTVVVGNAGQTPMVCLAVGGALVLFEALIENSLYMGIIAGGMMLGALNWVLVYYHIYEAQLYALPWVIYFAWLARKLGRSTTTGTVFECLALAALTLPIMAEATADSGVYYGMEAVGLGLVMAVVGSVMVDSLVSWWGIGVALIEALYLVPRYFWPGSQIPLICGAAGLVALAISVMVRLGREDNGAG